MFNRSFEIYDNTSFVNKHSRFGPETYIVHEDWILNKNRDPPTDAKLAEVVRKIVNESNRDALIVLDIETWNFHFVEQARIDLIRIMDFIKAALPNRKIGNYSIAPWRHVDATLEPKGSVLHQTWITGNNSVSSIADKSDILFPSLYTLTASQSEWGIFAASMIKEARRYAGNKKVIPFLWPFYHQSMGKYTNTHIDKHFWSYQLQTCARLCDGAIVWHDWPSPRTQWNVSFPFYKETLNFIEELKTQ